MKNTYILSLISSLLYSSSLYADYRKSVDDKGCWDGKDSNNDMCLTVDRAKWDGDTFRVYYLNKCSHRIYARTCNNRDGKTPECVAVGIKPGQVEQHYTFNASGRYSYKATGSVDAQRDWSCASRFSDWSD
jgi:hypothetical protein